MPLGRNRQQKEEEKTLKYALLRTGLKRQHTGFEIEQGPVVRRPISANPGLNFNAGLFFFSSKAFFPTIISILFRVANHQIVYKKN